MSLEIYKNHILIESLSKGTVLLHETNMKPKIVTPYSSLPITNHANSNYGSGLYNSFQKHRVDLIISAEELKNTGLLVGSIISGIAMASASQDPVALTSQWLENFRIAMKHTTYSSPPTVPDSYYSYQEVFYTAGKSPFPYAGYTWYSFQTPFVYDGVSNIMMSYSQDREATKYGEPIIKTIPIDSRYYQSKTGTFPFEGSSYSTGTYGVPSMKWEVSGLGIIKAQLAAFITASEAVLRDKSSYSTTTINNLQVVYDEAVLLFNNTSATQEKIDQDTERFTAVYANLVSFIDLKALIATTSDYPENTYTLASYAALNTAIVAANQSMMVSNVSQSTINNNKTAVQTAINNLVFIPFAGGKLTTVPTEIVSTGLLAYWDTGGRTNETDSLTVLPDISGNNWNMGLKGINGTTGSGYRGGHGLKLDAINDEMKTPGSKSLVSSAVTLEMIIKFDSNKYDHKIIWSTVSQYTDNSLYYQLRPKTVNYYGDVSYQVDGKGTLSWFNGLKDTTLFQDKVHLVITTEIVDNYAYRATYLNGILLENEESRLSLTFSTFDFSGFFNLTGNSEFPGNTFFGTRLYSKSLTAEEVTQNYNYEKTRWGLN